MENGNSDSIPKLNECVIPPDNVVIVGNDPVPRTEKFAQRNFL